MTEIGEVIVASRKTLGSWRLAAMIATLACISICSLALGADSARAGSPIYTYFVKPSTTQAGGHPDIYTEYKMGTWATEPTSACLCNTSKSLVQDFPTGFIGNPHATPQCTAVQLALRECPIDSQVGIVAVIPYQDLGHATAWLPYPVYNMVPAPDQAGLTAFTVLQTPILTELSARTGSDYGLRAITRGLQRDFTVFGVALFLWGVPASPIHDELRWGLTNQGGAHFCLLDSGDPRAYFERNEWPPETECPKFTSPHSSSSPETPFLSNPTTCAGPLVTEFETIAYDHETERATGTYPGITGCDQLSFNPSLSAKPTTTNTDSASGLDVHLSVPQFTSPSTPSPSELRAATVTLPDGFSINSNAAEGKTICTDEEAGFGTEDEAQCPEFSKIGTTSIDSSALPGPINGYLYLGEPRPGNRYRMILTADGFATHIKIAGTIQTDPGTGRLTFSFPELPQSPLTEFNLHVFGSERGSLATPTKCGTYAVESTFRPWAGELAEQRATQFFTLDHGPDGSPCPSSPRPLAPSFSAASAGNTGGEHSPFSVELVRRDGDQFLNGLEVTTPPGFSATLKGVPYCPDGAVNQLTGSGYTGLAEQASSACPAASQIGSAVAGAGSGSRPLYTSGKVYLAGPYKGAPLSLVVVIPAVSGPYDLGNITVRVGVRIDPITAQVTAISDPFPQILEGVPLRTRLIQVKLDRPGFTLNPTNCNRFSVRATVSGEEGGLATASSPFQVANCARLSYEPKLDIRLSGGVKRRGHPAIHATFTANRGEANSRYISVTLPPGLLLDNSHFGSVCTVVDFDNRNCPGRSRIGSATAISPLLDQPLSGDVYLRSSQEHRLPDMAIDLQGQVNFTLLAHIDSVKARLRTRFETVPDVPVTKFKLDLLGGAKGLLQNSEGLCGKRRRLTIRAVGQNGARSNSKPRLRTSCGRKGRRR
jgi:hypothetical protein